MTTMELPRPRGVRFGAWTAIFGLLVAAFLYATVMRFVKGLGATTNLSDAFPWGIWIGFDILCGVGLAAGAFTLMATVHLFHIEKFKPIVRPTLLTGYLGGAILTHLRVGDNFIGPIVFGVFIWGGLFLRDPRIRALIPLRS